MAKKAKTIEDIYKDDMKYLIKDLNQKIKLLGSMAYISHSGEIFVKDNDRQLERYCKFYNMEKAPITIRGTLFDTLDMFDMCKVLKISTMQVLQLKDAIVISQEGIDTELRINKVIDGDDIPNEQLYVKKSIFVVATTKSSSFVWEILRLRSG